MKLEKDKIIDSVLQKKIGFVPFEAQKQIIENQAREIVIGAGRRFGKSAVCAYMALRTILEPNKKVWIVAPTYDLTHKVFEYVVRWFAKVVPSQAEGITLRPYPKIRLAHGSTLECRSTDQTTGLLGEEVDLEIVDEASRIPRHVFDTYLYPVTSSRQGKIVLISTPFGKNWFYEHWIRAKESGAAFNFSSRENPFFPKEEWEEAKNRLPTSVFKQEYEAQFLEDAASVFRGVYEVVQENCLEDVKMDRSYIVGVDIARVNDFTVLTVVDCYTHKVVAWERFRDLDYALQKARIGALADRYNRARIIFDSTGMGDPVSEDLRRAGYMVEDIKLSSKSKSQLIEKLMLFIEQKGVFIPNNEILLDELTSYSYHIPEGRNLKSEKVRYGAPVGKYDDCVISLALAVWGLPDPTPRKPEYLKRNFSPSIKYEYT